MTEKILSSIFINQWVTLLVVSTLLMVCAEAGSRLAHLSRSLPDAADNPAAFAPLLKQVGEIHTALWSHASAAAAEQATPVTVSFINSLNETI